MSLLLRLSITGREAPVRLLHRIISKTNARNSLFCSMKDLKMEVLRISEGFDGARWLNKLVKESKTASFKGEVEEGKKKPEYYVNTGYAIRTLREEIPELFHKELSFDIYRDDIVFKDPINTFAGIDNYKSILWSLRFHFHGRIFFRALWIDIVSMRQPVENTIMVRWTVHGIPQTPRESRSRFDGNSEYKLDEDGKIYEHKVHNIAPSGPQNLQILAMEQLLGSIIYPSSTSNPTYPNLSSSLLLRRLNIASSFDRIN